MKIWQKQITISVNVEVQFSDYEIKLYTKKINRDYALYMVQHMLTIFASNLSILHKSG